MSKKNAFISVSQRLQAIFIIALLVGLALSAWTATLGRAATEIRVTGFEDKINTDGFCTLREAVIAANKNAASGGGPGECPAGSSTGADTIVLPPGTYTLTRTDNGKEDSSSTGDLDINGSVIIAPDPALTPPGSVTINTGAGFKDRIFHVLSGNVIIRGVTIAGGNPSLDGGGIYNQATLAIEQSTLTGNKTAGKGGGIYNAGTLSLTNVTISGNTAKDSGGGVFNNLGPSNINNVTIAANTADSDANGSGEGGGIFRSGGTVNFKNTLIGRNADNSAPPKRPDCWGTLISQGYNLIQNTTGCTISGDTTGNLTGVNPNLEDLQNNGGTTPTHELLVGSPAIDAGNPAAGSCAATDQRGISRPQGTRCDIGAFEVEDPAQPGPVFNVVAVVGTNDDRDDGLCSFAHCSLREAIKAANTRPNGMTPDEIHFSLTGASAVIQVGSTLPTITSPVIIDGTTQPGGSLVVDGSGAVGCADGLTINGGNTTLHGVVIQNFCGNGILLTTSGNNLIEDNTLTRNGGDGIRVESGIGNRLASNSISANGGLGIDLGGDGITQNDTGDPDSGANDLQNTPFLISAVPNTGSTLIEGRLNTTANTAYTLEFYANQLCDPSGSGEGETILGSTPGMTDADGNLVFQTSFDATLTEGHFVTATATSPDGSTSEFSSCVRVGLRNDSWPAAHRMTLPTGTPGVPFAIDQYLDRQGQSRWYKFHVLPNSRVIVTLTGLPANYDLSLYKDISTAFASLASPQDLVHLGAEFTPDVFSPDNFSPDVFSPDNFSPDNFSPDNFSPDNFSPDVFSPDNFSPDVFSPDNFSPDVFSPDNFSPDNFSPDNFSPDNFSPDNFSPDVFSPDAFSSAQTRSMIAVSAFEGIASEGISVNTWDNTGDFYVRVRGRNGAFNPGARFHLEVMLLPGNCGSLNTFQTPSDFAPEDGNFHTLILTDFSRLVGTDAEKNALLAKLNNEFKDQPEVNGVVVDVGQFDWIMDANGQADANYNCPFAKNLVAYAIKDIVDRYRAVNPLEYVVIVGNDNVIPFFRHPDQALLANEKNYVPPVSDRTASQASLKLGYVLSQDRYGASVEISHKDEALPIPDLAVGRLVENAADATRMLDAYHNTSSGVVATPTSALVTGYDFLADGARAVQTELEKGLGTPTDTLIVNRDIPPTSPCIWPDVSEHCAWTADHLRDQLLFGPRHDLIYLAGHFSASSTLAADFTTRLTSTELVASSADLENALVFSAGCHAGYNIVDAHGVAGVTREPDWAQAFAQKGATLIAGTGYQYGDTDFIEYSERLYQEFSQQLHAGFGPVPIGKALVAAKRAYLADTPQLRAIHEKALLEATLFGLPMLSVDLPQGRGPLPVDDSIVADTTRFNTDPGATLGLEFADVSLTPSLTPHSTILDIVGTTDTVTATYLEGSNRVVTNPGEPVLPAEVRNVSVDNIVLRGVGFRGGVYTDLRNVLPLIGAATTEMRGIHAPFLSNYYYPVRLWAVNYFEALAAGATRLVVTPAHFKLDEGAASRGTLRYFNEMDFRLYYSANIDSFAGGSTPALAASPSIVSVSAVPDGENVDFRIKVVGNPAAGIQQVWVTYTATDGPFAGSWKSLDLIQNASDSSLWEERLALNGTLPGELRYIAQAVNGVGLVALDTNLGAYYTPGFEVEPTVPTSLNLISPPTTGPYGTQASFTAELSSEGTPLEGQPVVFDLGPQRRQAMTDPSGHATVTLWLLALPDAHEITASFSGTSEFIASSATSPFTIDKQSTDLVIDPPSASVYLETETGIVATLSDANGRRLLEKTVFFILTGSEGSYSTSVITDYAGRAPLGKVPLPRGTYTVNAYFGGTILLHTGETVKLDDERYIPYSAAASSLIVLNRPPICTLAVPSVTSIWPPNNEFYPLSVLGVFDPDGDPIVTTIDGIFQDERVGAKPDGNILGINLLEIRAERDGNGDGRVYHIFFQADDGQGGACTGEVRTGIVTHDQGSDLDAIDGGPLFDSTVPSP
jgi:CSLREA domain-containing protein